MGSFADWLLQAAAEYGALASRTGAQGTGGDAARALDELLAFAEANPVVVILAGATLLLVVGFLRTGTYRS